MARALLITNPGAARTDPRIIRSVRDVLARRGLTVEAAGTTAAEDATELARRGVRDGAEIVAVYGGDGTTMRAVRGIQGLDVPLGVIPGGTGNILAGNLRIPRNPLRAAEVVAGGTVRPLDLGRRRRDQGVRSAAMPVRHGEDEAAPSGNRPGRHREQLHDRGRADPRQVDRQDQRCRRAAVDGQRPGLAERRVQAGQPLDDRPSLEPRGQLGCGRVRGHEHRPGEARRVAGRV